MPPTLSTLMTRLRQRRRTWRTPPLTCSTKPKHRSVCPIMHWCMFDLQTQSVPLISALCQIFKLMKMDSYRRFVRSPLYQSCTLASVEGKLLPQQGRMAPWDDVAAGSRSLGNKKVAGSWREYNYGAVQPCLMTLWLVHIKNAVAVDLSILWHSFHCVWGIVGSFSWMSWCVSNVK